MQIGVSESNNVDDNNCNMFWQDRIQKKMENYWLVFELIGREDKSPAGYK